MELSQISLEELHTISSKGNHVRVIEQYPKKLHKLPEYAIVRGKGYTILNPNPEMQLELLSTSDAALDIYELIQGGGPKPPEEPHTKSSGGITSG